ncbi:MAG TPA: twin-arginine translocase TatA/TatE family subunit [Dehalococcoidia bacterium]|nr:twin-arginine translocase TatA/TatE family subunit [Dehalococcoidia bacterium]
MFRPGPLEIGLIVFIVLILFGAGKLPQVGASLGKGIRAFRRGQSGEDEADEEEEEVEVVKPARKKATRLKKAASKKS